MCATAPAQEVSILHSFVATTTGTVTPEGTPTPALVQGPDGNFYGTTSLNAGNGAVIRMTPQGAVTILHQFGVALIGPSQVRDGTGPTGNLVFDGSGNLYGTTSGGGAEGYGTVYEIAADGTYSLVHVFEAANQLAQAQPDLHLGVYPEAGVIVGQDGNLYGTTAQGGEAGAGAVFKLTTTGTYTVINDFAATGDAKAPAIGLVEDAQGNFYGATSAGGTYGLGAIYKIDAQGRYTVLYNFTPAAYNFTLNPSYAAPALGGLSPNSSLTLGNDGNLYGTAAGTFYGGGAVYRVTPQGQFTLLHLFANGSVPSDGMEEASAIAAVTNSGVNRLVLGNDGDFYGTTPAGGAGGRGTIFKITPAGQETIVHAFGDGTVAKDGAAPVGIAQTSAGNFFGVTATGGTYGAGTAFEVTSDLPAFTSPMQVNAALGAAFTYHVAATQGPVTLSVTGLPPGLNFHSSTGNIFGTPTATGTTDVTLTATNANGSNSATLVISVYAPPAITSLLNATYSLSGYAYQIRATQNPTSFSATGLPPGMSVDPATGVFYGTPTQAGTYSVTLTASNVAGTGSAVLTLTLLSAAPTLEQEYEQIHLLGDGSVSGEGSFPAALTLGHDATFYGVTSQGGTSGAGTVFNLSPAGTARVVASLGGATTGTTPVGVVQGADGTLYGVTSSGGSANEGTIFKVGTVGTVTVLHAFGDGTVTNDGANPQAGLVLASDGNFYGTTQNGGSAGQGTVFKMTPGGAVTILHSFGDGTVTNDGAQPVAALVQDPSLTIGGAPVALVGTTLLGGANGDGTLFAITSTGMVQIWHSFGDPTVTTDGQLPRGSVACYQLTIYGTTTTGGSLGKGTVFAYGTTSGYSVLHNFGDGTVTNDGEDPNSGLTLAPLTVGWGSGLATLTTQTICGTTQNGGAYGEGTVFSISVGDTPGSSTVTILHSFDDPAVTSDGTIPSGGVSLGPDGNLYGTTIGGGDGAGTTYALVLQQGGALATEANTGWTCTGTIPTGMSFDPTTGILSGAPATTAAAGTYTLTITSVGEFGTPVAQTLTLTLNQTFSGWAALHGISATPNALSGTDKVPNLMKYFFDINPSVPMTPADLAAMPTLGSYTDSGGNVYLTLTFREFVGALGVSATLQSSTDMQNWTDVAPADLLSQQIGTDAATGDPIMEMGTTMAPSGSQFLRLNVTMP